LDGEGCFTASPNGIRVSVSNCFPWTLQALQGEFGGRIYRKSSKGKSAHVRAAYQWDSNGQSAIRCIQALLPYLIEKRPQAALVLDYHNWPPQSAKRRAIEAELKRLKRTDYQ
jgi:hypothetical protein